MWFVHEEDVVTPKLSLRSDLIGLGDFHLIVDVIIPAMRNRASLLLALPILCIAAFLGGFFIYNLPPVNQRLAWRVDDLRMQIKYALNPPEEAIFVPGGQVVQVVAATLQALTPTASATPTATNPAATPLPTSTTTSTLT